MTNTKAKTDSDSPPKRTKMRAAQKMFHGEVIVEEGEVFMYEGDELPEEHIAVKAARGDALGLPAPEQADPNAPPPNWTTRGYVDGANRGRA